MIRRPPRSTLFPTRRSSDLNARVDLVPLDPVQTEGRADDLGGSLARVERRVWILEDHLDLTPQRLEPRSEEHTSELQSQSNLVCRLLLEKKKKNTVRFDTHS